MKTTRPKPIPGWKPTTPDLECRAVDNLNSDDVPLAVHFWADWNGVDPLMDQGLQELVDRFTGRVEFYSVDVQSARGIELAAKFGVANLPTLLLLKLDANPSLIVGYDGVEKLADRIEKLLLPKIEEPS